MFYHMNNDWLWWMLSEKCSPCGTRTHAPYRQLRRQRFPCVWLNLLAYRGHGIRCPPKVHVSTQHSEVLTTRTENYASYERLLTASNWLILVDRPLLLITMLESTWHISIMYVSCLLCLFTKGYDMCWYEMNRMLESFIWHCEVANICLYMNND